MNSPRTSFKALPLLSGMSAAAPKAKKPSSA